MKKQEKDQIHAMTVDQLRKEIADLAKKMAGRVIAKKDANNRNVREGKLLRVKRAILLTVLRGKELKI